MAFFVYYSVVLDADNLIKPCPLVWITFQSVELITFIPLNPRSLKTIISQYPTYQQIKKQFQLKKLYQTWYFRQFQLVFFILFYPTIMVSQVSLLVSNNNNTDIPIWQQPFHNTLLMNQRIPQRRTYP